MRALVLSACLALAACGGVAWDTTIADTAEVRRQMIDSVRVGVTTETAFVTRWGPPLQKVREGARTEYVYRRQQEHTRFVIVTFDHGVAVAVRSSESEACRGTFPKRIPGYGFDRPDPVTPAGWCGPIERPGVPLDSVGLDRGGGGDGADGGSAGGSGLKLPK